MERDGGALKHLQHAGEKAVGPVSEHSPRTLFEVEKYKAFGAKKIEKKLKMNIEFPGILVNIFDEGRNSLSLLLFLLIIRVANLYPDHQGRRPNNEDRAAHRTVSCPWEGVRPVHIFTVRTIFKQIHTSCLCLKFPYKRFWTGTAATLLLIGSKITFLR